MPLPRPMFEIFVYSATMEGVHLRGGPVARGGLRWSDRREDFRTEVLGLMKAQMTKNSVIVPVGGGGLLSGSAIAAKAMRPGIQVIGCEPAGADDAKRSFDSGELLGMPDPNTIADGLRGALGTRTFADEHHPRVSSALAEDDALAFLAEPATRAVGKGPGHAFEIEITDYH